MDIGDVLEDRYELEERVGIGGTATVYRARDRELDRPVAIKVFGAASQLSDAARRRREARALAALRHPAIVTIFDARLDAEPPYLVLEYVHGRTLADALAGGPLGGTATREIGAAAASGLAAAHRDGVVHRDVKPANILLPEGETEIAARLLDFGIAHSVGAPRHTTAGSVLGSASYLSPEQARGEEVGPASDVYSLGLVLIECLTGRAAFPGSTPEALAARLLRPPPLDDPALEPEAALLTRMTTVEPDDRVDAAEVAALLAAPAPTRVLAPAVGAVSAAAAETEVLAPPPVEATSPLPRASAPAAPRSGVSRRVLAVAAAALAGLALVSAIVVGGLAGAPGSTDATERAKTPAAPTEEPPEPDPGPGNGNGNPGNGNGNPGNNGNGNGPKDD